MRHLVFLVVVAAGCGQLNDQPPAESAAELPRVRRLPDPELEADLSIAGPNVPIAIGPAGSVLHEVTLESGLRLGLIDTAGTLLAAVARSGEGPGEVQLPIPLRVSDTSVKAVDMATLRVTEWSLSGDLIQSLQLEQPILPTTEANGRWVAVDLTRGSPTPVWRPARVEGEWTPIGAGSEELDSVVRANADRTQLPPIGIRRGGFLVADGQDYRIAAIGIDGTPQGMIHRDLPPNLPSASQIEREMERNRRARRPDGKLRYERARLIQLEDSIRRTPLPWFRHGTALHADDLDRLWVIGVQHDTTFADVFVEQQWIGRHTFDCPGFAGRWALNRRWIALVCADTTGASATGARVVRYEIVSPEP